MDDGESIRRLKGGDIDGLEFLVKHHQTEALKLAYLTTRDYPMAEDIVQAAFVRVYERITQFDESRPFRPWFLRSVVNDALKAVSRNKCVSLEAGELQEDIVETIHTKYDVQDLFEEAETRQEVWAALSNLSPYQRAAIVMYYYLELSESEMANATNRPTSTVRRRLSDARRSLRRLLPTHIK